MKHEFQEPRLPLTSLFLIHLEDKSSSLSGAISIIIGDDMVTMCGWAATSSVIACLIPVPDIHPYLLTPRCRVLLEKLTGLQLLKKFPAFHGTRRLITALTSVRHLSLSWASPVQSIYPHPTSWRSILILSTHLRLGLPSGLLPSGFHTKTLNIPLSSPIGATCPAHLILLDFITRTILGEETGQTPYRLNYTPLLLVKC